MSPRAALLGLGGSASPRVRAPRRVGRSLAALRGMLSTAWPFCTAMQEAQERQKSTRAETDSKISDLKARPPPFTSCLPRAPPPSYNTAYLVATNLKPVSLTWRLQAENERLRALYGSKK